MAALSGQSQRHRSEGCGLSASQQRLADFSIPLDDDGTASRLYVLIRRDFQFGGGLVDHDPVTGEQTFTILAGRKSATGFVMQLTEQDVIDKDPRSFSKYWRGLNLYGFKVIRPEDLAVMYATFDYTAA